MSPLQGFARGDPALSFDDLSSGPSSSASSLFSNSPPTSPEPSSPALSTFNDQEFPLFQNNDSPLVMVVGGLGYIGSHTTLELLKAGYNVVVIDNLSNSFESTLDRVKLLARNHCQKNDLKVAMVKFHNMDYRSSEMRKVLERYQTSPSPSSPDAPSSRIAGVIHFAAYKSVEESISRPLAYYQNNVGGLVDFLVMLEEFGIKNFVFSSSATVYGTKAMEGKPLKEEDLVHHPENFIDDNGAQATRNPGITGITSPYGRSKYFSEAILADVANADDSWKIISLRYFNPVGCHESGILGEDPRQKPTNLFPVVAQVLRGARPQIDIFGSDWKTPDGTAIRDFIHVVDLAKGHVAALSASLKGRISQPFRAFNLGSGTGTSVAEVVNGMRDASRQDIPARMAGRRPGDVGYCVAATQRVNSEIGWKTEKTVADSSRDLWNFITMSSATEVVA